MNLARLGEDSLGKYGEFVSLSFEGREITNVEADRTSRRLANALRRLGVEPGDRVAVMLPNCPEVTQSYGGILKAGAVIVPVISWQKRMQRVQWMQRFMFWTTCGPMAVRSIPGEVRLNSP